MLFASLLWKEKEKQNYVSWLSFYSVHATLMRSYKGYVCIIYLHILAYKAFSAITLDCKIFLEKHLPADIVFSGSDVEETFRNILEIG